MKLRQLTKSFILFLAILVMMNGLLSFAKEQDDYDELTLRIKELSKEAETLNELADLYMDRGEYDKAESLYRRSLQIREKVLGPDHPDVATVLDNLGVLYDSLADYPKAELLLKRALEIRKGSLGSDHPKVAVSLTNLGFLHEHLGDYVSAERHYKRALEIGEKALGSNHPDVATILSRVGEMYISLMDYQKAEPPLERALAIRVESLGSSHPKVAKRLDALAQVNEGLGKFPEAQSLYQQALDIYEKAFGPYHPQIATTLQNLAVLYDYQGDFEKGQHLYLRAIAIDEKALGKDHPEVAIELVNLALSYAGSGNYRKSLETFIKANKIQMKKIDTILSFTSERQKLSCLKEVDWGFNGFFTLVANHLSSDREAVREAANIVLQKKGIVLESQIRLHSKSVGEKNPALLGLFQNLQRLREQIATLSFQKPNRGNINALRTQIDKLKEEKELLEGQLARFSQEYHFEKRIARATVDDLAQYLPKGSVLIDFTKPQFLDFQAKREEGLYGPRHYLAFLIYPAGEGDLQLFDLGEAEDIDKVITSFKREIQQLQGIGRLGSQNTKLKESSSKLYDLVFSPLRPSVGGRSRIFISPEGDLNLVPFEALVQKNGRYLVEDFTISYVTTGRDVLAADRQEREKRDAVILADPDFDLKSTQTVGEQGDRSSIERAHRTKRPHNRSSEMGQLHFPPLPMTKREGYAIFKTLKDELRVLPVLYMKGKALEEVLKAVQSPLILHIATHGFFLRDQTQAFAEEARDQEVSTENPLLRSGLALAGANTVLAAHTEGEDFEDGILTAEEVCGLNLQGTDLVVLSACETGLGDVKIGEGVFGLRRAFIQAGARTLVTSLWRVSDESTVNLMEDFYKNLKTMDKGEALRQAQLKLMRSDKETDRQRGVGGISKGKSIGKTIDTSHPYFWAPFIVIGDWR